MPRVLQLIDHMGSGGAQTIVHDLARGLGELDAGQGEDSEAVRRELLAELRTKGSSPT